MWLPSWSLMHTLVSCSILFFALHFVRAHTHAQVPECLGLGRPTCSVPYLVSVAAALCTNPSGCRFCQLVSASSSPRGGCLCMRWSRGSWGGATLQVWAVGLISSGSQCHLYCAFAFILRGKCLSPIQSIRSLNLHRVTYRHREIRWASVVCGLVLGQCPRMEGQAQSTGCGLFS